MCSDTGGNNWKGIRIIRIGAQRGDKRVAAARFISPPLPIPQDAVKWISVLCKVAI